jgi:hypothetical protein
VNPETSSSSSFASASASVVDPCGVVAAADVLSALASVVPDAASRSINATAEDTLSPSCRYDLSPPLREPNKNGTMIPWDRVLIDYVRKVPDGNPNQEKPKIYSSDPLLQGYLEYELGPDYKYAEVNVIPNGLQAPGALLMKLSPDLLVVIAGLPNDLETIEPLNQRAYAAVYEVVKSHPDRLPAG